jgi:hypothetical protein
MPPVLAGGSLLKMIGASQINTVNKNKPETTCLTMRLCKAAASLGISERLLWEWAHKGMVPHFQLGKAVLYPVDSFEEWLKQ